MTTANHLQIPQQPQRQDSTQDQLRDLHIIAARVGCYDAADWLWKAAGFGGREPAWPLVSAIAAITAPCRAKVYHGPGHQSSTRCRLTGEHELHEAVYGSEHQLAQWTGDEGMTGFFDEPPQGEES